MLYKLLFVMTLGDFQCRHRASQEHFPTSQT